VSEAGVLSHARVKSKSVRGGGTGACLGVGWDADACSGGCAGTFGAGTSCVLKTVSFPDTRKMPPPTRPAFFSSRTCFASLNEAGFGVGPASAVGAAVDLGSREVESRRELMGFRRSFVVLVLAGVSESTIVIGTRRRFGGAATEDVDGTGGGTARSAGAVRCICCYCEQRKIGTREHTVLPFPLKMSWSTRSSSALTAALFGSILSAHCRSAGKKANPKYIRKTGKIKDAPLWASPSFWRATRACALRKNAFTFFLDKLSTVLQSRSASSFLLRVEKNPDSAKRRTLRV
jgi:hypothetical protein